MRTQNCINHFVEFTSSDNSIATIDKDTGVLHTIAPGSVTITAKSKNNKSDSITLLVKYILIGLNILNLPSNLLEIHDEAFYGVLSDAIIIPDGCKAIGKKAFADCPNLIYVYIPSSVTSIALDAFDGCSNIFIDTK